ncbi:MAG: penicillin-binding protein 2 [Schleiferilactobacillus perolens]|uniref:peptidoglycan D,D-transpeptidase FtsI family protein n=1 Tax=Schleiferilactobacillus perolens TaxID=100468 RepID=UPI0039E86C0B
MHSGNQQTPQRKKSKIPFRLNFLLLLVFLLFAALMAQLAYLQVVNGDMFQAEVERTDSSIVTKEVARGQVYDSKGRLLVGNEPESAITYTKNASVTAAQIRAVADRLATLIQMPDTIKLTKRDEVDYYLAKKENLEAAGKALTKSQKYNAAGDERSGTEQYQFEVANTMAKGVTLSKSEQDAARIYARMAGAYQLSTVTIKNSGVTATEVAQVSEHLTEIPGVSVGTDWERSYPNGNSMRSVIGSVSSEQQGLPEDELNSLLAQGYSRNDRVGTSYLEKAYEGVLKGTKSRTQVDVHANNSVTDEQTIYGGKAGDNLNLTIDSDYQKLVEKVLKEQFDRAKSAGDAQYSDGAYAIAMNPKTGAILAMAGVQNDPKTKKESDDALGTINRNFVMGSAVKGATVLGALMDGVITPSSNTQVDDPIYLPATPVKKSVYPAGTYSSLNAVQALEVSSNIYMMNLALKEGKARYVPHQLINFGNNVFTIMRSYFSMFGLGPKTGIDLPGEIGSYLGPTHNDEGQLNSGKALDLSYGNYDQYTLVQMVQYISTIANGGYRMKPYIVQSIQENGTEGTKGAIVDSTTPTILNRVPFTQDELNVVKQGMYNVVHGSMAWGTAHPLKDITPAMSAKTGTAQSFYIDPDHPTANPPETTNSSFVGFAPSNDPQIAIAIVFPNLDADSEGNYNQQVARTMIEQYYKLNNIK